VISFDYELWNGVHLQELGLKRNTNLAAHFEQIVDAQHF